MSRLLTPARLLALTSLDLPLGWTVREAPDAPGCLFVERPATPDTPDYLTPPSRRGSRPSCTPGGPVAPQDRLGLNRIAMAVWHAGLDPEWVHEGAYRTEPVVLQGEFLALAKACGSVTAAARELGVEPNTLRNWSRGSTSPRGLILRHAVSVFAAHGLPSPWEK